MRNKKIIRYDTFPINSSKGPIHIVRMHQLTILLLDVTPFVRILQILPTYNVRSNVMCTYYADGSRANYTFAVQSH